MRARGRQPIVYHLPEAGILLKAAHRRIKAASSGPTRSHSYVTAQPVPSTEISGRFIYSPSEELQLMKYLGIGRSVSFDVELKAKVKTKLLQSVDPLRLKTSSLLFDVIAPASDRACPSHRQLPNPAICTQLQFPCRVAGFGVANAISIGTWPPASACQWVRGCPPPCLPASPLFATRFSLDSRCGTYSASGAGKWEMRRNLFSHLLLVVGCWLLVVSCWLFFKYQYKT